MTTRSRGVIAVRLYGALLGLSGLVLMVAGGRLIALGGSLYYLPAGIALLASAILAWRRKRAAMWVYSALLLATVVWSIWEVGFDAWSIMPRLVFLAAIGGWMLTPWFRHALPPPPADASRHNGKALVLGIIMALLLGGLLHPLNPPAPDPRYQAGIGSFPQARQPVPASAAPGEWHHWGNDQGGSRFSSLVQITRENVGQLEKVWDVPLAHTANGNKAGLEVTPLMIGDTLYACNGVNEIFALDAETGEERWHSETAGELGRTCRGVAYYRVPQASGACAERIFAATGAATLNAFDAHTGQRCGGFGQAGTVDLLTGMTKAPKTYYHVTSAPAVIRGKIVLGGWVSDGQFWGEPSGVIRAFDAVTGELAWAWDMGRPDRTGAPPPGETYTPATPNSWAPMSADEQLGLVYLPTGNATPDYFGAHRRPFDDEYSSSVVALDVETGKVRWSFQTVHHDVWDYDVASQPSLVDLPTDEGTIPALVQVTKRGEIFVLNRETGEPIHRVLEDWVSLLGKVPEERLSRTQPFSVDLPSFRNPDIRETDMWGITPFDQLYCRIKFREARYKGTLTPPGTTPSIMSPGYVGGMNWGSASIDPERGVMVVNSMKMANYVKLIPRAEADQQGIRPVGGNAAAAEVGGIVAQAGTLYAANPDVFMSPLGAPCQAPPYGYLSAVDLVTGKLIWSRWLGNARDLGPLGIRAMVPLPLGTPNSGGSMTTRSGLVFIGASMDRTFRAFDQSSGEELWNDRLPIGAFATPMSYFSPNSRRQFIVVAAGGSKNLGAADSARLIAYALPRSPASR